MEKFEVVWYRAALQLGDDDMAAGRQPQPVGAGEGLKNFSTSATNSCF
jgi:hypothetical protein